MKLILFSIGLAVSAQVATAADEPDSRTPLERYEGDTYFALVMCKSKLRIALLYAESGTQQNEKSDYEGCIASGKSKAKASLVQALRTVKKTKAQEALKSYHVAFVSALEGLRPGADERKINYEQRQQSLEGKVTEAWARFEIEQ